MKYGFWLSNIRGIGPAKIHLLLAAGGTAEGVYGLSEQALRATGGLSDADVDAILASKSAWDPDREWCRLAESNISFVTEEDSRYPKRLRNIHNPPYALYYLGNLPDPSKKAVAIVGARGRSAYGSAIARELGAALGASGVEVVSGLARGIDADGHIGALDGNGRTYAVLGCGVNICYPKQNRYLYDRILAEGGGILSEYPPDTEPAATFFPSRNRIISGLCDCVAVIEARLKSGSLITADFAMEQGRDVYALPGRVTDPLSQGANRLIGQGAGVIENVADFLAELHMIRENSAFGMDFRKNLLEKDEALVYSLLDFSPLGIGGLMEQSKWELSDLTEILRRLEQKGFIREIIPNFYVRTR